MVIFLFINLTIYEINFKKKIYFQKEFDFLCHCVIQVMERPEQLSALEKSAILETLMILR